MPGRIQLSRRKGWRMPENTVKVARPGRWGNPFRVGGHFKVGDIESGSRFQMAWCEAYFPKAGDGFTLIRDNAMAVDFYRRLMATGFRKDAIGELRGHNLACWCKPSEPCHADVLLEIANVPLSPDTREG